MSRLPQPSIPWGYALSVRLRTCFRKRSLAFFTVACALLFSFVALCSRSALAAENAAREPDAQSIQYRRVFVPAEKMDVWPREGEKLIPVEARDFENWIRAANEIAFRPKNGATISLAEYSATLEHDGRLHGDGKWTIALRGDRTAFLYLGESPIIVRDANWQGTPSEPARIGAWGRSGHEPSRFGIEVKRTGVVEFKWHVQTRVVDSQIEIPWQAPTSNLVRLKLNLPENIQPRFDGGVVLNSVQQPASEKSGKPRRRWTVALGGPQAMTLRLATGVKPVPNEDAKISLSEQIEYRVTARGLDLAATWRLEGEFGRKRELTVAVPPGLQVSAVTSEDRDLTWRVVRDASSPTDAAIIELPKTDATKPLEITFHAWQPLVVDSPWRLPRIRTEGVHWSAGNFTLTASEDFDIQRLEPTDCIETNVSLPTADDHAEESHSLTAFAPSATIDVTLSPRQADATVRAGSSLSLVDPDLNGRLVTQWNLAHGAQHQLTGKLAAGWVVEAVETVPADAMTDWYIDGRGADRQIEVQLSRSASASRNVSVIITGRLQRFSLAEPIPIDAMRMVAWKARSARHLLTFQSNEPFTVESVGKLPEIGFESLDDNDRELLDQTSEDKIFDITSAGTSAGLQLVMRRGKYAANIEVALTHENEILRHESRIVVEPASSPIDRLLIHSTVPLGDEVRWVDSAPTISVAAEKLVKGDPQRANLPKEGEAWLLRLSQPTSKPIEFSATVRTKRPEHALVPILSVPEASQQTGRILVRSRKPNALWLEPTRLQPVPLSSEALKKNERTDFSQLCAVYRYDPADCRDALLAPKLLATASSGASSDSINIRHIQLESFFWPDGNGVHRATYQLNNHGPVELKTPKPAEGRLVSATLDGRPLNVATAASSPDISISLPARSAISNLSLCFETQGAPLAAGRELRPPLNFNDLPFLSGEWIVWLPDEYSVSGTSIWSESPGFNWRQRLFGLLGRPSGSRPFNPFRLADGAALVNGLADGNIVGIEQVPQQTQATQDGVHHGSIDLISSAAPTATPPAGWHKYQESFVVGGPSPVVVMHPPAVTSWTIAILLTCFLVGRGLQRFQTEVFAIALAIVAAAALLMPIAYSNLAAGAILGLLLALFADWPRRPASAEESAFPRRAKTAVVAPVAVLLAVGIARLSFAAQAETNGVRAQLPKLYRVLIPSDEKGQPVGTKYYVGDEFLHTLLAATERDDEQDRWLLGETKFSGELIENPGQKDVIAGKCTATFSIETLARDTAVVLPLVRSQAEWNTTVMLDGIPLPLQWRDGDRGCFVEIAEPGRYALAVNCQPKTQTRDGRSEFEIAIPSVPGANIELQYPEALARPTILHAIDLPMPTTRRNAIAGALDPSSPIRVQWSQQQKLVAGATGVSITEMRWLDIKPAEIELITKYIFDGTEHRPNTMSIAYDQRWKLLTNIKTAAGDQKDVNRATWKVLQVPIPSDSTVRQEVLLRWRLTDPTTLGHLRLPVIEVTSAPATKRWLAITSDASLECEVLNAAAAEGTASEFLEMWSDADGEPDPQSVVTNFDPQGNLNLAIRPRESEPTIDEALNVAAGLGGLRVNYEAKVAPASLPAFRLALSVPTDLSINSVRVDEAGQQIPVRWSRSAKNRATIFFGQPMAKPFRVIVDGTMPLDPDGRGVFPHLSATATETATQRIRLYRDDDVHVDIANASAANETKGDPTDSPPPQWASRPVGTFYLDSDAAAVARITVVPSKPQTSGETLIQLNRESGSWYAIYRCQLAIEDDALDTLRIQIPETCIGPFDVQSDIPVTTEFKSGDGQTSVLTVRLANTVAKGGNVDLRLRTRLTPFVGNAVSVPPIMLEGLTKSRRFVSVPVGADSQIVSWTEAGVRRASVPQKLLSGVSNPNPASTLNFEILSDPFQVTTRSPSAPEITPQIRIADTAIVAGDLGSKEIVTRLILAPQGLTDCTLQLPASQKLVSIELDGHPALTRRLDESHLQIALTSPQLPQLITIVSHSQGDNSGRNAASQRPTLLAGGQPIPAEVSLWSFAHPQLSARRIVDGADEASATELAALRFDRLVSIAEAAKATAIELPSPDGVNWYQSWSRLLAEARSQIQQPAIVSPTDRAESQVSRTADEQVTQAVRRLDKWLADCGKAFAVPETKQPPTTTEATSPSSSLQVSAPDAAVWTYYVAEGGNDRLNLQIQPQNLTATQVRLIGLPLIAALLITGIWLMRLPAANDFLCRWPHALGILFGIAYWAWMWPSWVGILIATGCLWLALRFDWPGRSLRTEASTVLRASRTT